MFIFNAFRIALREIRRNLTRAFLTVLGIIIGVAAVVTMVTLGQGTTEAIQAQISALGNNLLILRPGVGFGPQMAASGVPNFSEADAQAIARQVPGIAAVAPVCRMNMSTISEQDARTTAVVGTTPEYFDISRWIIEAGRNFNDTELLAGTPVCIIGATVQKELFKEGFRSPIGQKIRIGSASCEVIGILHAKGQMGSMDQDDIIVVPLSTMQRRISGRTTVQDINTIFISAQNAENTDMATEGINTLMHKRRNLSPNQKPNFSVIDARQFMKARSEATELMTMLLAAVASVSLLVGGIGIMNIMLVSVTERTREIGIRLAIGARAREVLLQFLVEAVVLSCAGGLLGIGTAIGLCIGLAPVIGVNFTFNPEINILAFIFSAIVGIIFGFAPARRAARLDPIEALRHE
ncbi:MAG: ABC transporter permease [Puniceicoccales bacterium]|jgi:putative ABC transport system permease protein|nr:ABC transporter permease [Puniceicoccales bacterium]